MTQITSLYIGNRQSGKTTKLIEDLCHNLLHDPHTKNLIFSKSLTRDELYRSLPAFNNPKISLGDYKLERLINNQSVHIYIDELDLCDRKKSFDVVNNLSMSRPKSVHINTSPLYLRSKKDLNVNHTHTTDPLIKALQITDFEFEFLFNESTADKLHLTFWPSQKEYYLTQGLGMISLFD